MLYIKEANLKKNKKRKNNKTINLLKIKNKRINNPTLGLLIPLQKRTTKICKNFSVKITNFNKQQQKH